MLQLGASGNTVGIGVHAVCEHVAPQWLTVRDIREPKYLQPMRINYLRFCRCNTYAFCVFWPGMFRFWVNFFQLVKKCQVFQRLLYKLGFLQENVLEKKLVIFHALKSWKEMHYSEYFSAFVDYLCSAFYLWVSREFIFYSSSIQIHILNLPLSVMYNATTTQWVFCS